MIAKINGVFTVSCTPYSGRGDSRGQDGSGQFKEPGMSGLLVCCSDEIQPTYSHVRQERLRNFESRQQYAWCVLRFVSPKTLGAHTRTPLAGSRILGNRGAGSRHARHQVLLANFRDRTAGSAALQFQRHLYAEYLIQAMYRCMLCHLRARNCSNHLTHMCVPFLCSDDADLASSPAMKKHAASVMNTVGAAVIRAHTYKHKHKRTQWSRSHKYKTKRSFN